MATNVNAYVTQLSPNGGATNDGWKIGYLEATSKAAQNDTITIKNAVAVIDANLKIVTTGAFETCTLATNVITLTSSTTGATVRGEVYYR
jgi:hypothetical protein